jgi:NAD(P)H-dependent flavin oxidoreductase YrpB (nitropropane dioxygenase family)
MCDAVIIEGPKAGGHLGFKLEQLQSPEFYDNYDGEIQAIIQYVKSFEPLYNKKIPVIFAGGVYDRSDIDHYMALGCDGVQMATRFVGTYECDADDAYKQAYIDAAKEDITLVSSPVGMPGRAISNAFIEARKTNKESIGKCYQCLEHCNPKEIPYCITGALARAAKGDRENSLLFCGSNAYRVDKLTSVHDIISELNA